MVNAMRAALAVLILLSGSTATAVNHAGVDIAPLVRPEGQTRPWPLLGSAVVNRSFIPFYGLAMHAPADALAQGDIGLGLTPLQITLVWYANALPKEQVEEHFRKLYFQVTDEEARRRIGNRLEKFLALLPPAVRGQKIMFEYSPDGGMIVSAEGGGREHFAGIDFNRGLLAMWLGPNADPEVRKGLTTAP
ncbi:MAG: chalcone isomerase family protein [Rhodanobacteraceae bacterium]|nr:chalcone isomerase family protein [Rhodanobacteraceae bacterium]